LYRRWRERRERKRARERDQEERMERGGTPRRRASRVEAEPSRVMVLSSLKCCG